ncbi:MAG: tributyrin esterase [Chloroflexi bacterium]|nr:tributyrin esterase [Chloroflexota bacterium]
MLAVATALDVKDLNLRQASAAIKQCTPSETIEILSAAHLHGLLAGLKTGEYEIVGDAGDYLGVLNDGATIRVSGNVGQYVGDNMTRGLIEVAGSAAYGAGLYPYGGTLVIRGNAGNFTATMNKGATIIVCGDVGDESATYHLAGDFIVVGNAGSNFGNYLIRGHLYIGGEFKSQGHNALIEELTIEDAQKLRRYFEQFDVNADATRFRKLVAETAKPFYGKIVKRHE